MIEQRPLPVMGGSMLTGMPRIMVITSTNNMVMVGADNRHQWRACAVGADG
jgi:hypothetical protein